MRKILLLLLVFGLVTACAGVVSAADDNNTTNLPSDNNTVKPPETENTTATTTTPTENTTTATTTVATTAATTTVTPSPKTDLDVSINANVTSGKIPLTVNFTAVVNDSLVNSYKWEVHKDERYKNGRSVEFTYKETGEYTVTLIVEPKDSLKYNKVEKTVKITATEDALDASFTASTTSGTAPLAVKFTDTSRGATSWAWSIYKTDSGSRTLQKELSDRNITYTFQNAGTYQVELIAKKGSNTSSETKTIAVNAKATTAPTTKATTKPTTAATTAATTQPVVKAAYSAGDDTIPNPMDVIDEFIRLLLAMLNPAKYNVEI